MADLKKGADAPIIDANINATTKTVETPETNNAPASLITIKGKALDSLKAFGKPVAYASGTKWEKYGITHFQVYTCGNLRFTSNEDKFATAVANDDVAEIRYTAGTDAQGGTSYFEFTTRQQASKRRKDKFEDDFFTLENFSANPQLGAKLAQANIDKILNASS